MEGLTRGQLQKGSRREGILRNFFTKASRENNHPAGDYVHSFAHSLAFAISLSVFVLKATFLINSARNY